MKSWLITGGRLLDPARGIDKTGDIFIAGGAIAWLGEGTLPETGYEVLPAQGMVVCPGFIDLHCHLRQPGFEYKETIATGTRAAARGGFTTICCMPNTHPVLDDAAGIKYINDTAAGEGVVRVLPIGSITLGGSGRELAPLAELAAAGAVAFSDDGAPVVSAGIMRRALEFSRQSGLPIIDHCEDTSLTQGAAINDGAVAHKLGLRGMPARAEEIMVARDLMAAALTGGRLHIAHVSTAGSVALTGGRLHIAHVSTAGSVALIRRAKELGISVTAEATPHHLTLTEDVVIKQGAGAKVNPPLRTVDDIKALIAGLKTGVIDCIATDHAPHAAADKQGGLERAAFGISGFETALGSLMGLVHRGDIALGLLVEKMTAAPARILGRRLGTLEPGATADLTVFDPARQWVVDPAKFASKGRNTPLAGATLKGRVRATFCGGELVYGDETLPVGAKDAA